MAEQGPVGPLAYAFYTKALPTQSKMEPKKPIANNRLLNISTYCQYQAMPTIKTIVDVNIWDEKAIVIESNPTDGFVKCLM